MRRILIAGTAVFLGAGSASASDFPPTGSGPMCREVAAPQPILKRVLERLVAVSSFTTPIVLVALEEDSGGLAGAIDPRSPGNDSALARIEVGPDLLRELAQTELEAACVLAHELTHLIHRDGSAMQARADAWARGQPAETRDGDPGLRFKRWMSANMREWSRVSRAAERRADLEGTRLVARAYGDREAAARACTDFLRRWGRLDQGYPGSYAEDSEGAAHPSPDERVLAIVAAANREDPSFPAMCLPADGP